MYIDNTFLEEAVHTVFRFLNISIILNGLKPGAGALRILVPGLEKPEPSKPRPLKLKTLNNGIREVPNSTWVLKLKILNIY